MANAKVYRVGICMGWFGSRTLKPTHLFSNHACIRAPHQHEQQVFNKKTHKAIAMCKGELCRFKELDLGFAMLTTKSREL